MLDLIFIALFQAAAGDAAEATTPTEPSETAAAPAPEAVASNEAPGSEQQTAQEERVCHREAVVGSRLTTLVCSTRRARNEHENDARDMLHRVTTIRDGQGG